jgi:threonine aldolase
MSRNQPVVPFAHRQFASDNYAGICPEAWTAMAAANAGHCRAYGDDEYTQRVCEKLREFFETDCEVFFTFNGTAANSLSLASLCQSYHSVVCHELSHVETDECGAPEFYSNGTKILLAGGERGKLDPAAVERVATRRGDVHFPKTRALSITQPTEVGTVYTIAELRALGDLARRLGLKVHMDGARFAAALASLGCRPRQIAWEVGVDVLCLGGTKEGLAVGEAVVFFNKELAWEFEYRCKQAGQLCSKMRFLAAPWLGLLEGGALLRHAAHTLRCARLLAKRLGEIPGVRILFPVEANAVFIQMPPEVENELLRRGWVFYNFIAAGGSRLMCSWDTTEDDVDAFVADMQDAMSTTPLTGATRPINAH